ncbi:MAG: MliC family protein [Raineya sp.]|jgi:membrane-bound inhibitor of C-type lysozyme|nr:MliC family protein [Raineya sp.]
MTIKTLKIAFLLTILVFFSSQKSVAQEKVTDEIVNSSAVDKKGNKLEMSFNNTKNTVTLKFKGKTIVLKGQTPASGIWYKNDRYELRGKGENIDLTKDGKTIFVAKPKE